MSIIEAPSIRNLLKKDLNPKEDQGLIEVARSGSVEAMARRLHMLMCEEEARVKGGRENILSYRFFRRIADRIPDDIPLSQSQKTYRALGSKNPTRERNIGKKVFVFFLWLRTIMDEIDAVSNEGRHSDYDLDKLTNEALKAVVGKLEKPDDSISSKLHGKGALKGQIKALVREAIGKYNAKESTALGSKPESNRLSKEEFARIREENVEYLSDKQRKYTILRYGLDEDGRKWHIKEIAEKYGVATQTVVGTLRRAGLNLMHPERLKRNAERRRGDYAL